MSLRDLPKSLIDAVCEVVADSSEKRSKLTTQLRAEGLRRFGVKRESQLTEADQKALYAWVQMKLDEEMCGCEHEISTEDHMPGDDVLYNKGGKMKKQMDEDDTADKDYDGDGEVESSSDEYLGSKDKAIKAAMKNEEESDEVSEEDEVDFDEEDETYTHKNEATTMTDKQKFSALRNINHVEVRRGSAGKNRITISLHYMGKKLASMDSPMNSSSKQPETVWITPDGDNLLKKQGILKENVCVDSTQLATNGAVGVGNAAIAKPKHADVIHDTNPLTGVTEYRLLLQYATNEGTRIYPPTSLPGAKSVADLRTLVDGLPEFNEAVDTALVAAASLGEAANS